MHALGARSRREKLQLPESISFLIFSAIVLMSGAEEIATALNRFRRDGLDLMGGADSEALAHLLEDYFGQEEVVPPGSKL